MKLPNKIIIVDSLRSTDSMLRFDKWEGYDPKKQMLHMAFKFNELIDYLRAAPEIPNELPVKLKREGKEAVHEHRWKQLFKINNHALEECQDCGETRERLIKIGQ